ncbi:hypothetical protein GCM10012275_23840 [Longimycelium tulufanense]|uniref:Uncharacterized protein n=1 Tax=Longimycelium tulufanense TaxID=907463 RepID=A0A8J3FTU4_9PSEU|nr:hypothetical protein [Longimycelium tulufanense]GGM52151.1 hypothetical protein GCM10012275_23840 [Longimycelium tulufanense]
MAKWKVKRTLLLFGGGFLLVVVAAWYFTSDRDPGSGQGGPENTVVLPQSPKDSVRALYGYVAANRGGQACALFQPEAASGFAEAMGGGDCGEAMRRLSGEVRDKSGYANPGFPAGSATVSGGRAEISSCAMKVSGGRLLGAFTLERQDNGSWIITDHRTEPANCSTG